MNKIQSFFKYNWKVKPVIPMLTTNDIKILIRNREPRTCPVVVPSYKLIFFYNQKSAATYWKYLLHYIQNISTVREPHILQDPVKSGFTFLRDFNATEITYMMYSKTWTKATFVREPRERLLSAYLDKVVKQNFFQRRCNKNISSLGEFLKVIKTCKNSHWESQVRAPLHFYKDMMIGKFENISKFTKALLTKIGAWNTKVEKWLQSDELSLRYRIHSVGGANKLHLFYNRNLENEIFDMYSLDYKVFGFKQDYIT
ncbi:unnamed protein product [Mytilus coruscus]|uniref:Carbohydrate sulfotransferase n=1 Tax=Mytilus coruscus TaxID=42192 RepID=A0A6J8AZ24_MYTCO|nr:unnamed protein product [Mytilus coruscus]